MQRLRPESGFSLARSLGLGARARPVCSLLALALYACGGSGDKTRDAAALAVAQTPTDAASSEDAAPPPNPLAGKQLITIVPGEKIGRISIGMPLSNLESLARDWTKEELDGGTLSLRKQPWHVIVEDGVASEMTFTLDANILPVVANRAVRESTTMSEVAKLFPDCQPPKAEGGLELISCQGGRTRLEKEGPDGKVVIRFVRLPPPKTKTKRSARK